MTSAAFQKVLGATGYLAATGRAAPGLTLADDSQAARLKAVFHDERVGLKAAAVFTTQSTPTSIFKDAGDKLPTSDEIRTWYEAAWNVGVAPLLWIITPTDVRLYDCYASPAVPKIGTPSEPTAIERYVLDSETRLRELDASCGRLATETGAFWSSAVGAKIDRQHRVDRELLAEIAALEHDLVELTTDTSPESRACARDFAQRFIGRCIFTWYLIDRGLAQRFLPPDLPADLGAMFETTERAFELFKWLRSTFNGDLFPMDDQGAESEYLSEQHLVCIRDFIEGRSLIPERKGQGRLFRFRFNAIPIELVSSIYQQFARSSATEDADTQGLHYTPVELVHLTLDPVFEGLEPSARVIDVACGSGAFLVEAFRRLVWKATGGQTAPRSLVREILYRQLYGVDINRSALGIAAFSLYLAALELDDEPVTDIADLKFDHLIDTTLFEANSVEGTLPDTLTAAPFDVVMGNPPWTFVKRTKKSTADKGSVPRHRRSPDQAFLNLAIQLAGDAGRIGMIMKATPFFSKDARAVEARNSLLTRLAPAALINLSYLRREELFPDATGPALLVFSRCDLAADPKRLLVGSIPWTPDFRRTGIFHVGPGEIRSTPLDRVLSTPTVLKAATFGSVRDGWLIEKLERDLPTLRAAMGEFGLLEKVHRGQGYQVKGDLNVPPPEYYDLKVVTPETFDAFRLNERKLEPFNHATLHRPRKSGIFRGPLLLCSKGGNSASAERGRYSAAVYASDILYTENFYGVSFRSTNNAFAYALSGILNSSLTAFQFALGGPTWGLERPTVEPRDLLSIRVPSFIAADRSLINAVVDAERSAAAAPDDFGRLAALDAAVFDLYELEPEERVLAADGVDRARFLIFENRKERMEFVASPRSDALRSYAGQVVSTINAYLRAREERHVEATVYDRRFQNADLLAGLPGMTAVRFCMARGKPTSTPVIREGNAKDLEKLAAMLRGRFAADIPPYLNERRQLRLYGDDDLFILKPSEARCWTRTSGLNDADVILADHWMRRPNGAARG